MGLFAWFDMLNSYPCYC